MNCLTRLARAIFSKPAAPPPPVMCPFCHERELHVNEGHGVFYCFACLSGGTTDQLEERIKLNAGGPP